MTDSEEISELLDIWNRAVLSGDTGNVLECYADDAVLLPTLSCRARYNHEEIRDYFEHFLSGKPEVEVMEQNIRIYGDLAVNSGLYHFLMRKEGTELSARFTFVYRKCDSCWLIVEHHSSLQPE
ncbi:MAG: SgcJ/EcaC family oxidoreductase [Candidatus Krumholzibacteriales bacterium]